MNKSEIAEKAARELLYNYTTDKDDADCIKDAKAIVERAIAESQAPQPTVSYGPPHNRDGEAGSCTRCGSIHRGIVKNRTTPEGREFWDHVDKVAADCCLRCGRTRPEHDFNSPTACGLFEEPHPTQQPVKKFEERSRDLGDESAESGAKTDPEPKGTCSKHVGLHINIEELCEEWILAD